jgi:hypothetical protein
VTRTRVRNLNRPTLRPLARPPSDPDIVRRSPLPTLVPCIEDTSRLNEQQLDLRLRKGLVLDTLRDHEHLSGRNVDRAVAKIDAKIPFEDDECLIRW